MKKTINQLKAILLLAICLNAGSTFAQSTTPKWAKTYSGTDVIDDYGRAVTTDASGNVYITAGANWGFHYAVVTIKYNSLVQPNGQQLLTLLIPAIVRLNRVSPLP